mgnify:CR=1 FL=1
MGGVTGRDVSREAEEWGLDMAQVGETACDLDAYGHACTNAGDAVGLPQRGAGANTTFKPLESFFSKQAVMGLDPLFTALARVRAIYSNALHQPNSTSSVQKPSNIAENVKISATPTTGNRCSGGLY